MIRPDPSSTAVIPDIVHLKSIHVDDATLPSRWADVDTTTADARPFLPRDLEGFGRVARTHKKSPSG